MKNIKVKNIISWTGIAISLCISSFWAFWGINEFFHEGCYSSSFFNALFLFFVQYMSFAIVFTVLPLFAIKYKKMGLVLYGLFGVFCALFFSGASFQVAYLSLSIPFVLLGLFFYFGKFNNFNTVKWIIIIPPILIVFIFGTPLFFRNINRIDDGNYRERVIDCQDKKIIWAARGLGWPDDGVNWAEAMKTCQHLSADGKSVLEQEVNIWRLPSVMDAIKCQQYHNENAGGFWDENSGQAKYDKTPDKETPLWKPGSEIVYYWTSDMSKDTNGQAYIFTYNGKIYDKDLRYAPNYQSFRCIRDYEELSEKNLEFKDFPQRDLAIEEYLVSQNDFAWQTKEGSKNVCVFENLGDNDSLFPLSLWVYCREYKVENDNIIELSGSSGPVLVNYPNELSYFSIDNFFHEKPRDGSLYYKDIQNIFPKSLHNKIFLYRGQDGLNNKLLKKIQSESIVD